MKKIIKNKKLLLIILLLLLGVGGTFAYFFNRNTFSNIFISRDAPIIVTDETFESPSDWVPGTITPKVLDIHNENSYPVGVRVKFDASWVDSNGNSLPLYQCVEFSNETCTESDWTMLDDSTHNKIYGTYCVNNKVCTNAIEAAYINYDNLDKWKMGEDGYFYYYQGLASNTTAESPIKSVTFNENVVGDVTCTTDNLGNTTCTSTGSSYDGGKYSLKITTEMIDNDNFNMIWGNVNFPYLYDKVSKSSTKTTYNELDNANYNYPVYFDASVNTNNVKFANHCWQIVRTTETGGVKLLYNGEYDETEKCSTNRGTHVGYATENSSWQDLNSNYYYGTDYTFDGTNFKLAGTLSQVTYNGLNIADIKGKYTCESTSSTGTCTTLYLVENAYYETINNSEGTTLNATRAYVLELNSNSHYSQFGRNPFNRYYGSPAYVGYMYNKVYPYQTRSISSISVPSSGAIVLGSSITNNGDGTYTIGGTTTTTDFSNWSRIYSKISANRFMCIGNSSTCSDPYFITNAGSSFYYARNIRTETYKYGSSFTYDSGTGKYTLTGTINDIYSPYYQYNLAGNTHYTCFSQTTECNQVYFFYYVNAGGSSYGSGGLSTEMYYIEVGDVSGNYDTETKYHISGVNIMPALTRMLYGTSTEDVNVKDSTMKFAIDKWYEHTMIPYQSYLEDIYMCNNREVISYAVSGWANGNAQSNVNGYLLFNASTDNNMKQLNCSFSIADKFSMSNSKARLTYPVAMVSGPEYYNLTNYNSISVYSGLLTNQWWWVSAPNSFTHSIAAGMYVNEYGHASNILTVYRDSGVRPTVSLKPNTKVVSGTGSVSDPYVIN